MQFIIFTKHLEGKDIPGLIEAIRFAGAEGADLCVRPGYPVNPENAGTALPAAAQAFRDAGLDVPLITTPGDFTDPSVAYAEPLYAACAEAGVRFIKLGYWYMGPEGYWPTVDKVRQQLEGFARLSEKHGPKTCIHNHSGITMGLNSSSVMNLLRGFDPKHVGVFVDPGHLSVVGEPLAMALSIVRDYVSLFAFKDVIRQRVFRDGKAGWQMEVVPLGMGYVEWDALLGLLRDIDFQGPVSFHSEYSGQPVDTVVDLARIDIRFIRNKLAA